MKKVQTGIIPLLEDENGNLYHGEEIVFTEEMMKEVAESEEFKELIATLPKEQQEEWMRQLKEFGLG